LKVIGHALRAVVVPQLQVACEGGYDEPAKVTPHTPTDRLPRLESVYRRVGMDADAFGRNDPSVFERFTETGSARRVWL
jgi:hypothetical protein